MKRLLLLVSITLLSIASASAQCTPDPQYTEPGIYPDSATGFNSGCVGQPYEQLITNVVPVDTTTEIIPGFPVTLAFDSIVIVSFTGLPSSGNLTYACNTSLGGCSFAGGQAGCAIITGTPDASDVGTHNLAITVDVYVGGLSTPQATEVIDWYFILIEDVPVISQSGADLVSSSTINQWQLDGSDIAGATGQTHTPTTNGSYTVVGNCGTSQPYVVSDVGLGENGLSTVIAYPNPTNSILTLSGLDVNTETITITNINGQVMNVFTDVNTTSKEINVEHLESGIYFVRIDASDVIRFVKK